MTTPPLPSPLNASQSTYGFPTPSPALLDHPALRDARTPPRTHEVLPDLDKTPTTPRVMKITEAEAYALKVRAANDTDSHIMTGVSISTNQFEGNVNKSKESVGEIVDEEIRSSTPDLPSEPWTFSDDQVAGFRENLNGILNSMARITPRMATNPDAIAIELAKFVGRLINSEWAEVKVGHESIVSVIREAATYRTPVDIPPPPPVKNVSFAPTPIPTPANAPTPMEVDASPPRISATAKGKKKATPPPPTPQHPDIISPVFASPIKVSAVPKPLIQPSKTGKQALNETLAGVTPRMPVSGSSRHAMGRDASGSNAPSANAVTAAGRARDANGSHAPQNPPTSGKNAPAPTAPAPIIMNETIQWAKALKDQCPEMSFQDALKAVAPMVNTPPSSNEVVVPKSKKALAAQKAAQGITGGLNRKSAQFAFSHVVQPERFGDMGKVVDAINRHLVFNKSQMR
ncbi:hypothetical protein AGABI1DRAFT_96036, partial [Agaricus bisporus var. burnettii JB137-S8]